MKLERERVELLNDCMKNDDYKRIEYNTWHLASYPALMMMLELVSRIK